jgi:hypothetical protein
MPDTKRAKLLLFGPFSEPQALYLFDIRYRHANHEYRLVHRILSLRKTGEFLRGLELSEMPYRGLKRPLCWQIA